MSVWGEKLDTIFDDRNFGYFRVFNAVLDPDLELSEIDFFIYSKICRHAGKKPTAFFSLAKLKKHMKWGNSTVSASIKKLQAVGLIDTKLTGKGYEFRLIGSVADMMGSPTGKSSENGSPVRKDKFPRGEGGVPEGGNKEDSFKKTPKEDKSGAIAPVKDSNLVKAYMDKQEADGMEPLRPSPAEIGMLKTMASKGVTSQELPKLIDNCFVDKKYSVDYLLKNIVSLRAKVIESKKDKRAEWYAPKKYKYKSVCDCGGFEEHHPDPKAEWCWRCNKRAKLFEVETGKQIIYGT